MAGDPARDDARPAGSPRRATRRSEATSGSIRPETRSTSATSCRSSGLLRLQRFGGRPVALVGGGTGMIGDPSGRSAERNLLDRETLERNVVGIRGQLERFLDFSPGDRSATLVNNLDWLGEIGLIDFLRDTGKHFTVPYMLAKDSVQVRLERGLSFTEFSYMLLQSYDFAHMYRTMGVELQMGGADQWGNITAGLELIRRTAGLADDAEPAHALRLQAAAGTRRARSSARARSAIRSGWTLSGRRRSRSTSTGSTSTTGISGRTCAGSPSSRASGSRRSRRRSPRTRRRVRRSARWRSTSRPGRTARPPRPARSPIPRRCSRPPRSSIRRRSRRSTSRRAASNSTRDGSTRAWRSSSPRPGSSRRVARRAG